MGVFGVTPSLGGKVVNTMDKIIKENITILKLLVRQLKGLHNVFMEIYGMDFGFITGCFYPTLKNDYTYVVYDEESEEYKLIELIVDINYLNDYKTAGIGLGAVVMDTGRGSSYSEKAMNESVQMEKVYLEQVLNREVEPRELCVYINTETLLEASLVLIFTIFFHNKYPAETLVPMMLSTDRANLDKAIQSIWEEYQYNFAVATSSIGIQLTYPIYQQTGYRIGVKGIAHYNKGEFTGVAVEAFPISLKDDAV